MKIEQKKRARQNVFKAIKTGMAGFAIATIMLGCYGDIKDYCKAEAECEGNSDEAEKACVEVYKGLRKASKEYDCKDQFDDYMACCTGHGTCEEEIWGDAVEKYYECEDDACMQEVTSMYECYSKSSSQEYLYNL